MTERSSRDTRGIPAERRRVIDAEHRHLRRLLATIDATSDTAAMVPLLRQLQTLLVVHFDQEEWQGGLRIMLAGRAPHLVPVLDELESEHEALLTDVTHLIDQARRSEDPTAVHATFRELRDRLHGHEDRETALIVDAFEQGLKER